MFFYIKRCIFIFICLKIDIIGLKNLKNLGLEKYTSDIITHYGTFLPDLVGENFYHSSLSFLAKYFQDPVGKIL